MARNVRGDRLGRAVLNQYANLQNDLPPLPFGCEDLFIDRGGNPLPPGKKRANAIRERVAICERSRDLPVGGTGSTHGWNDHKVSNPFHEVLNELTPFVWKCLYYWPVEELRRTFGITRDDLWSAGCEALWRVQRTWGDAAPF
jgi:hypothetical protein